MKANALQGPIHPTLGIAMDMSIQLKAENGAICTLSLSFNNEGPLGTFFRYIGDTATYIARYDDLYTGKDEKIDVSKVAVSMNGIELQDREFFAAIREGREPNASVEQVLPCYRVLDGFERGWARGRYFWVYAGTGPPRLLPLVGEDQGGGRAVLRDKRVAAYSIISPVRATPHPRPAPQEGAGALTPSILPKCSRP